VVLCRKSRSLVKKHNTKKLQLISLLFLNEQPKQSPSAVTSDLVGLLFFYPVSACKTNNSYIEPFFKSRPKKGFPQFFGGMPQDLILFKPRFLFLAD